MATASWVFFVVRVGARVGVGVLREGGEAVGTAASVDEVGMVVVMVMVVVSSHRWMRAVLVVPFDLRGS